MLTRIMSQFSVDFFSLAVPKNFVGEPFCVSQKFWCQIFSVEAFLSRGTERLPWGKLLSSVSEKCRSRKNCGKMGGLGREGVSRFSVKTVYSLSAEKMRSGTVCCVTEIVWRRFLCLRGLCHNFLSIFSLSRYQRTS